MDNTTNKECVGTNGTANINIEPFIYTWERKLKTEIDNETFIEFLKDNKRTIEEMQNIDNHLFLMGEFYGVSFINMHTIFLRDAKQLNSNLIVLTKGFGKTTFLKAIAENNKKHVVAMPDKMFESFLAERKPEEFNNKICVHYDLVMGILGLTRKQRDQILGFWTSILSDGSYYRENKKPLENVKTLAMFALAKESYQEHRKEMFESTFLDRLTVINRDVEHEHKVAILKRMRNDKTEPFKIKLQPWARNRQPSVDMERFGDVIDNYAMDYDDLNIMSATRAQTYIKQFLLANCGLNGRKNVKKTDILLYKLVHEKHLHAIGASMTQRIAHYMRKNPTATNSDVSSVFRCSRQTVFRAKML